MTTLQQTETGPQVVTDAAAGGAPPGWHMRTFRLLYEAADRWSTHKADKYSAAVAMYAILSLAPLLVITIKVTAQVLEKEAAERQVERQVKGFLGPRGAAAVNDMVAHAAKPGTGVLATVISAGLLVFTASGVFVELRDDLNSIWGVDPRTRAGVWAVVKDRLLSVGMVFAVGFLLLISQVVSTVLTALSEHVLGNAGWAAAAGDFFVSALAITLLFALLFKFLSDARMAWGDVLFGSAVTAVLFKIGQYGQALYFTYGTTESAYGAAGTFVVILLWVYYSCWILFYGAELIGVYAGLPGAPGGPAGEPSAK